MSTDDHDKPAAPRSDRPVSVTPSAASVMPVTRLISRPSLQVIDGRLVAVLELVRAA
ncbi:MAG: hypothetical protein AB1730_01400 [Myxococcota bacterium]|jgi:hypothetical protein